MPFAKLGLTRPLLRGVQSMGYCDATLFSSAPYRPRWKAAMLSPQRVEVLAGFKSGKYEVMVATDIAAQGIDVTGMGHVINYDVRQHPQDYVHRIGRTGRALQPGEAFTPVTGDESKKLAAMERFIGQEIKRLAMEGFALAPALCENVRKPVRPAHSFPTTAATHPAQPDYIAK